MSVNLVRRDFDYIGCTTMQCTLAIIKPDLMASPPRVRALFDLISQHGFELIDKRRLLLSPSRADAFYEEHKGRFFQPRLVDFMSSGPITAIVLRRHDAIAELRRIVGPTSPFRARVSSPNSLRALFGTTDTRNAIHASDSIDAVKKEMAFFFDDE